MKSELPKFKITIDEEYSELGQDLGIEMIALTSRPAIFTKGFAFSSDLPKEKMTFNDNLKYRIGAPMMVPMEIYRNDGPDMEDSEYYVQFTPEEIEKIHSKFMKNLSTKKDIFNLEHDTEKIVPAYVIEAILVDSEIKKTMIFDQYGVDVPLGTSFIVSQITDKDYYNELVKNDQIGYSIEGFLGLSEIIKQKLKKQEMKKEFNLPAGEYPLADGNILIVAEDGSTSIKEVVIEEVVLEEVIEEEVVLEEVIEEEVIEEEVKLEEVITPEVDTYTKAEIDEKFAEIYQMLASKEIDNEIELEDEKEVEEVKLSIHERFAQFSRFNKQ